MSDILQDDMIKNQIKDFLEMAMGDDVSNFNINDIDDVLKAPDIIEQINEFNKDQNHNDDSFMQGLLVGLSTGYRFGLIFATQTLFKRLDDIKSADKDSPIEVTPTLLN